MSLIMHKSKKGITVFIRVTSEQLLYSVLNLKPYINLLLDIAVIKFFQVVYCPFKILLGFSTLRLHTC